MITIATCTTIAAILAAANPGDAVQLTGTCPTITISRTYVPPLPIDASAATVAGLVITGGGVGWTGGGITAGPLGYGARLLRATNVTLSQILFTGAGRAVVIDHSSDIVISGNRLSEMTIDGIDVASSQRVTIDRNVCVSFSTGLAHPDCFQLWTRAGNPMSDVTITGNVAIGRLQGVSLFNHIERIPPDPGFDRITITGNIVRNLYPQGIAVMDCRNCTVTGNDARSLPGAPFRTSINVARTTGKVCGNVSDLVTATLAAGVC